MSEKSLLNIVWNSQNFPIDVGQNLIGLHWKGPRSLSPAEIHASVREVVHGSDGLYKIAASQLMVGDDRVALPISGKSSLILPILIPLIHELEQIGVKTKNLVIICEQNEFDDLKTALRPELLVVIHNAPNIQDWSYLASTQAGTRVYLNRNMLDSDVIIPVIAAEPHGDGMKKGFLHGLWPTFSDFQTQKALQLKYRENPKKRKQVLKEIQEVLWLGGFHLAVTVIPGADGPASVVAGRPSDIQKMVYPQINTNWNCNTQQTDAQNVLLSAYGNSNAKIGWAELLQVIKNTLLLRKFNQVVLSLDLEETAIDSLASLATHGETISDRSAQRLFRKLLKLASDQKIYILSNIPESITDDLNLIHLESQKELANLLNRSRGQWLLIEQADRVRIQN